MTRSLSSAEHKRLGDSPATTRLREQRLEARRQLLNLKNRMWHTDPAHQHARAALQEAVRAQAARVAEIEAQLRDEIVVTAAVEITTAAEARVERRMRLQHLLLVLDRAAPPSCADIVSRLRAAVNLELRTLEGRTSCD